uniref:BAR domain-containing protein n=1 Tax=Steinernema glaseri TaxID=37863 RepID=A0A1I7YYG9_9BILA
MFKWMKTRVLAKGKQLSVVDQNPSLVKQMRTFYALKEESERIVAEVEHFLKKFELSRGVNRNAADHLSIALSKISECVDLKKGSFGDHFLFQEQAYEDVGRLQRKLVVDLREKVVEPLKSHTLLSHNRIHQEIQKLSFDRQQLEREGTLEAEGLKTSVVKLKQKCPLKKDIARVRIQKEYEHQMEVVQSEMDKMPAILARHCRVLQSFAEILRGYHQNMAKTLLEAGAIKI